MSLEAIPVVVVNTAAVNSDSDAGLSGNAPVLLREIAELARRLLDSGEDVGRRKVFEDERIGQQIGVAELPRVRFAENLLDCEPSVRVQLLIVLGADRIGERLSSFNRDRHHQRPFTALLLLWSWSWSW